MSDSVWELGRIPEGIWNMVDETMRGGAIPVRRPQNGKCCRRAVTDIYETETAVIASFELPGVQKENIELNVTETEIEVKVEKKSEVEKEDQKKGYYRFESCTNSFYRRMPLPAEVMPDNTKAEFKDGILKVEMAKKEAKPENQATKINID